MKKNKRLALQVSAIVTLMFILIIAFIGFIIVIELSVLIVLLR